MSSNVNPIAVANGSGYPLEAAIEAISKKWEGVTHWYVLRREHPWLHPATRETQFLDFVLGGQEYDSVTGSLYRRRYVVGCKRLDGTWVFPVSVPSKSELGATRGGVYLGCGALLGLSLVIWAGTQVLETAKIVFWLTSFDQEEELMKRIFCYMGAIAVLFVGACDSNKKLSQDNAEKAIRQALPTLSGGSADIWGLNRCFNPQSIVSIQPVNQFSETEATSIVSFKCDVETRPFGLRFVFKKNVDKKWQLSNLACAEGFEGYGCDHSGVQIWVQHNQNLSVIAQ